MLKGAKKSIKKGLIKYILISTHSQKLHNDCSLFLKKNKYKIIASADFDNETSSYDGVLVGRYSKYKGIDSISLSNRSKFKLVDQKFINDLLKKG